MVLGVLFCVAGNVLILRGGERRAARILTAACV